MMLYWGECMDEVQLTAKRAGQVMREARMTKWLAGLFYPSCVGAAVKYKAKVASISEEELDRAMQPAWTAFKKSARLASSTPTRLAQAMGVGDTWGELQAERVSMILRQLNGSSPRVKAAWRAYLFNYQRQKGVTDGPILQHRINEDKVYTGTWIERVHRWMVKNGIEITGGRDLVIPMKREGDIGIMAICPGKIKNAVAEVCRRNHRWTLSEWVTYEGEWRREVKQFGKDDGIITQELGLDEARETREFWYETVPERWDEARRQLGQWSREAIQLGSVVAWLDKGEVEVGRIIRFEAGGDVQIRRWQQSGMSAAAEEYKDRSTSVETWRAEEGLGPRRMTMYWQEQRRTLLPTMAELSQTWGDPAEDRGVG